MEQDEVRSDAESDASARARASTPTSGKRRWWPRFLARTRRFWRRVILLLGPVVLTGLIIWAIYQFHSERMAYELLIITGMSLFGFGTTVILAPAAMGGGLQIPLLDETVQLHLGTWEIALWLIYLNAAAAFLYAYNLDLLEKVPVIGPFLQRARQNAVKSLQQHPWIRRLAGVGVAFFVLTPLPGSGQLGGCFVGRVVGLTRRTTFLVVAFAGTLVAVFYAMFGQYIGRLLDDAEVGTGLRIAGAIALLVVVYYLVKLLRYLGRAPEEEESAASESRSTSR